MVEPVSLLLIVGYVADKIAAQYIKERWGARLLNWVFENTYSSALKEVVQETILTFAKKYPPPAGKPRRLPFYFSERLTEALLKFSFFETKVDLSDFKSEETYIPATKEQLIEFSELFYQIAKKHPRLRKLELVEGYQKKIYQISEQINEVITAINKLSAELQNVKKGLRLTPLTWTDWTTEIQRGPNLEFITTNGIKELSEEMWKSISTQSSHITLSGLSGLGKTRLIYEILKVKVDNKDRVFYFNCEGADAESYYLIIDELLFRNAYLVLDNCTNSNREKITKRYYTSPTSISIISINEDLVRARSELPIDTYQITPDQCTAIVDQILGQYDLGPSDLDFIKRIVGGYTLVAVLLAESFKNNNRFTPESHSSFLTRILGPRIDQGNSRHYARALSLFSRVGYSGGLESELEYISKNKDLTRTSYVDSSDAMRTMSDLCSHYLAIQIFQQEGRHIALRCKPIAFLLAAEWWDDVGAETAFKVLSELPNKLALALVEQMQFVDTIPSAQETVYKLVNGPFISAKVLNTDSGSRIFRELVKVNSIAGSDALYKVFISMPIDELKSYDLGRRELVWCLEYLCFETSTFDNASKVLAHFAVAENESHISNNATGQFLQLFNIYLAGTEVNFDRRIQLLEYCWNQQNPEFKFLVLKALRTAITNTTFTRSVGAEKRGLKPDVEDYIPKPEDINTYWQFCLNKIHSIIGQEDNLRDDALKVLSDTLRGQLTSPSAAFALKTFEDTLRFRQNRIEVFRTITFVLRYERQRLSPDIVARLENILEANRPATFEERFESIVVSPRMEEITSDSYSKFHEENLNRVSQLAEEFVKSDKKVIGNLELLFNPELQFGFYFGQEVGKLLRVSIDKYSTFLNDTLIGYKQIFREPHSFIFLSGLISTAPAEFDTTPLIKDLVTSSDIKIGSYRVLSWVPLTKEQFHFLMSEVIEGRHDPRELLTFRYYKFLKEIKSEFLLNEFDRLIKMGGKAQWVVLDLLWHYSEESDEIKTKSVKIIRTLLFEGQLLDKGQVAYDEMHLWSEACRKLLRGTNDIELAIRITQQVIAGFKDHYFGSRADIYLRNYWNIIVPDYIDHVWSLISEALLGQDYWVYSGIGRGLGYELSTRRESDGILFDSYEAVESLLKDWCDNYSPDAPNAIVRMSPIFNKEWTDWHPFMKWLIDNYGENSDFQSQLNSHMNTYSWIGSMSPLYHSLIKLLNSLANHPKPAIARWALDQIQELQSREKRDRIHDEEREFGI